MHHPDGKFSVDIGDKDGRVLIEIERRTQASWGDEPFRFSELNVLERRFKPQQRFMVLVTNQPVTRGLVAFWYSLKEGRLKEQPNRFMKKGELVYRVPQRELLEIDLTERTGDPIEVLNYRRIKSLLAMQPHNIGGCSIKLDILGPEPPFGMTASEWRKLKDEAEVPLLDAKPLMLEDVRERIKQSRLF